MRCKSCNTPFFASLVTNKDGTIEFEELCSSCKTDSIRGNNIGYEFVHAIEEEPTVRIAREGSLIPENY